MTQINRLLFFYIAALVLLLVSVMGSMLLTEMQATRLENDAKDINISGRQRMLSQRIIYLAQDITASAAGDIPQTRDALLDAVDEFETAIATFEESHFALSQRPDMTPGLYDLYFQPRPDGSLDARIREYIDLARQIAADPADIESLRALKAIEQQGLLGELDGAVTRIEEISVSRVNQLRDLERYSLLIACIIVLAEVAFVFVPGHRFVRRTLDRLHDQNRKLETARVAVFGQNEELLDKNAQIASDRARLQAAWEESEALRREQADFTYSVSHDLKSPTNTIHLLLNELAVGQDETWDDDARELLALALQTVRRMGEQIEDVLQYSAANHEPAQPTWIDMKASVEAVLADMASELRVSGAQINVAVSGAIFGHATQVRILLQNVIANAIKFQPSGAEPIISVTCNACDDAPGVVLSVSDNGIGIAPENIERIFGLFQRLHVRETYPGTGLGLATCQRIASNHGGNIMVRSALGEGSKFDITLHGVPQLDIATPTMEQAA